MSYICLIISKHKYVCIRQGDPLSPFLFIIVMEGLNVAMRSTVQNSLYSGIDLPNNGPSITHLFYKDDVLFVSD